MQEQKISPDNLPKNDLEIIGNQIEKLRNTPEYQSTPQREVVKESIKQAYLNVDLSSDSNQGNLDHRENSLLPDYMKNAPQEEVNFVESLIHIALTQGVEASIREARRINNPRILDDLHDALTDKVMSRLGEQN